ncbi:DUF4118 domain-containing protein, partial [Escherichia coli]|nr:DUF4118 domain-containing protein [Escherichia coli]
MTSIPRPSSHPSDTRADDPARLADPGPFSANGFNAAPAIRPSAWLVAIGAAAVGTIGRVLLESAVGIHLPFYLAFPVVTIAAWYGGFWPGMLA